MNNKVCAKGYEFCGETSIGVITGGLPVMTESAALLKDLATETKYLRCMFRSLSSTPVTTLFADIILKNGGKEVAKIENFQYNAKARRNGFFGQNVGVALKWDAEFDTAEVKVKKAVLEDGDVLVSSGEDITFPQPAYIREYLQSEELEQEYRRESGAVGPFCPQKAGGWWRCTCGELNADSEETCFACGKEAGPLFDLLNTEALETNLAEYKEERARIEEEERIKQEEEERIAAEKRAVRNAKAKKISIIAAVAVVVLAIAFAFVKFALPVINYNSAASAFEDGDYEAAYTKFESLGEYKDSRNMAVEAHYRFAQGLVEDGEYEKAIAVFKEMINYKDSTACCKEAEYLYAKQLIEEEKYEEALANLDELGEYEDSATLEKEAKYGYIGANLDSENETTYRYLRELKSKSYKDSEEIYNDLYKWTVKLVINDSETDSATKKDEISKYDNVYCHVTLNGGTPNGTTRLKYSATYPDGSKATGAWDKAWEEGTEGTCSFWYDIPEYGKTGKFTVSIYDADTGKKLGAKSVELTN